MKLLLTSGGLTTDILRKKFLDLIEKDAESIKVAFIDTASKVEKDKGFVERDIENLKKMGEIEITRIDISDPKDAWESVIDSADVIWVEGGNTFYLLNEVVKSGLNNTLREIIEGKLYVGVSAGSILVTPSIAISGVEPGDPNNVGVSDLSGLSWVDFEVSPHTPDVVSLRNVEEYAKQSGRKLYAYDDQTAVLVEDNNISIVGDGFSKEIN